MKHTIAEYATGALNVSRLVKKFYRQWEDMPKYFAKADFAKSYSGKDGLTPFFEPLDTLIKLGDDVYGSYNYLLPQELRISHRALKQAIQSKLDSGNFEKEENIRHTKDLFRKTIPSAARLGLAKKASQLSKAKGSYTREDFSELFASYYSFLEHVLPKFKGKTITNFATVSSISKAV